jgi:hypothetical protein
VSSPEATAEILSRLERIDAALASLASGVRAPAPREGKPLRLTTRETCVALRCSSKVLRGHAARGCLTQLRPKGRGRGKPVYYLPEEVQALATGEDAARELVAKRKLLNRTR